MFHYQSSRKHSVTRRRLWNMCLIWLLLSGGGFAQEVFSFRHLSTSDDFSLNPVTSFAQDTLGQLWFATQNGLIRYDGLHQKRVGVGAFRSLQREANNFQDLAILRNGDIWLASGAGVYIYQPDQNEFRNFSDWLGAKPPFDLMAINCILQDEAGYVWVGTRRGLYRCHPETKETRNVDFGFPPPAILSLLTAENGELWIGTAVGLYHIGGQQLVGRHTSELKATRVSVTADVPILTLAKRANDPLWYGTAKGLFSLSDDGGEVLPHELGKGGIDENYVRNLVFDADDRLWAGTFAGIFIQQEGGDFFNVAHDPNRPYSLHNNKIKALFRDRQQTMWISSFYGGINTWNRQQLKFSLLDEMIGNQLSNRVVSTVVQGEDETIFLGVDDIGVIRYDVITKRAGQINRTTKGQKIGTVKSLVKLPGGQLLIGSQSNGVFLHDPGREKTVALDGSLPTGLAGGKTSVLSLATTAEGEAWIGTLDGGLFRLRAGTTTLESVDVVDATGAVIPTWAFRVLTFSRQGDLLIGTNAFAGKITAEDLAAGRFVLRPYGLSGVVDNRIYVEDILEDALGNVWVATFNQGLMRLSGEELLPIQIGGVTTVFTIVSNGRNGLWLSTKQGIIDFRPSQGEYRMYDRRDGVPPNEFNYDAGLMGADSTLYFGGASGVTMFSPRQLGETNTYAPDVVITDFSLADRSVSVGDETEILTRDIEFTDRLELGYEQNRFSLAFVMPSHIHTAKHTYYYRLLGLEAEWVETSASSVSYTLQRGGNYEFQVRGVNNDGVATAAVKSLDIYLHSPPWKTWWAYLAYALLAALLLYGAFRTLVTNLQLQHQLALESQEVSRQKQLSRQKVHLFTNISHDLRTPLTLITTSLEAILQDIQARTPLVRRLLNLRKNTKVLSNLIDEFMDLGRIEGGELTLKPAKENVVSIAAEVFAAFEDQALQGGYDYEFISNEASVYLNADRRQLSKVLFNLLGNAFKYTPPGSRITLELRPGKEWVEIAVADNGPGMSTEKLKAVFERYYEIPGRVRYNGFDSESGIGLTIARKIVELHGGNLVATSTPGNGSTFTALLPVNASVLPDSLGSPERNEMRETEPRPASKLMSLREADVAVSPALPAQTHTILVVEDHEEVAELITGILSPRYRVLQARDGLEGFKLAVSERPDLIVSDVMMPVVDGLQFCKRIKQDARTRHLPVILLTAKVSSEARLEGLATGADDYLTKPFDVKELLFKCRNVIGTRQQLRDKMQLKNNPGIPPQPATGVSGQDLRLAAERFVRVNVGNEGFSVSDLSEHLGISRSSLFTRFKSWGLPTPKEYLISVRMRHAAGLIESGKHNFAEIAYEVGFRDPSYFSKTFKKHFRVSPSDYAKSFTNDQYQNGN